MMPRARILLALLLALAVPAAARGQSAGPAPWGLFSVRYDTRTSDFIYAAYGYGHAFAMVGALQNPRSGYSELLGAVGATFSIAGGPTHTVAVGAAHATEAWYAQLYYLPAVHEGPLWVRATVEAYLPLERAGTPQLDVSPLSATLSITRRLEGGAAVDLAATRGERTSAAVGPELRLALPKATLGTDVQHVLHDGATRFRLFFTTAF